MLSEQNMVIPLATPSKLTEWLGLNSYVSVGTISLGPNDLIVDRFLCENGIKIHARRYPGKEYHEVGIMYTDEAVARNIISYII